MTKRLKEAMAAYMAVMTRPLAEGELGWSPPPVSTMRDKHWSKHLRGYWPEYTSVRVADIRKHSEKMQWCRENAQFYWVAGNQAMWYFSDRNTAVMFKLTFGGDLGEE